MCSQKEQKQASLNLASSTLHTLNTRTHKHTPEPPDRFRPSEHPQQWPSLKLTQTVALTISDPAGLLHTW